MAQYVYIYDEGGIVRVERRDSPLKDLAVEGKKVFDLVRDVGSALNVVVISDKYGKVGSALVDAQASERLSDDERREITRTLVTFDYITDTPRREFVPGEYERTHQPRASDPGPAAPPADRVAVGSFDP